MLAHCPLAMSGDQMTWVMYALAAVTVLYIVVRPWLRRQKDPLAGVPSIGLAQQRQVERDMQNLLVELSQMARQISAQLDTRAARLEALIDEADKRIERLGRLTGAAADRAEPHRSADAPSAQADVTDGAAAPDIAAAPAAASPSADDRYRDVYAMADAGSSPADIAKALGRPRGEIELILALRGSAQRRGEGSEG